MCVHLCVCTYVRECMLTCGCVIVIENGIRSLLHCCDVLEADFSLEVYFHDLVYIVVFFSPSNMCLFSRP
jgi:hypothetical protein